MREIKFRVFDPKNGTYFRGWDDSEITITFFEENEKGEIGYIQFKDLGCSCNPDDACGGCVDIWPTEPLTKDSIIEQFTGLKDKNGVEIYEGDVMRYKVVNVSLGPIEWETRVGVVEFVPAMFICGKFQLKAFQMERYEFEVIGNIHENKNMLNQS